MEGRIQEALSLTVYSQGAKPCRPVIPFVSRRAGSSHSGFPCGPRSAATTATAPCSLIQLVRVTTSAGSRYCIHRSLYHSSQQTGANPRQLGHISNNSSFRQKHLGVPDGSDGSDGTSYPLTENYTLPIAQATGSVA